jgi:hypothetical protein
VPGVDNEGRGWGRRPDNRPLTNEPGSPREESAQQRGTLGRVENAVEHFNLKADSTTVVRSGCRSCWMILTQHQSASPGACAPGSESACGGTRSRKSLAAD